MEVGRGFVQRGLFQLKRAWKEAALAKKSTGLSGLPEENAGTGETLSNGKKQSLMRGNKQEAHETQKEEEEEEECSGNGENNEKYE